MRIAQIIPTIGFGGAEREVARLGYLLIKKGMNCDIVCLYEEGHLATEAKLSGAKVISLNLKRKSPFLLRYNSLKIFLGEEKYDIIHVHLVPWAVLAARFAGAKAVFFTEHGFSPKNSILSQFTERMILRCCDRIVVVARDLININNRKRCFPKEKLVFIPNSVDMSRFNISINRQEFRLNLKVPDEHIFILSVGRLYPVKGHIYLVQAAKRVLLSYPKATFAIAGGGPLLNDLKAHAAACGLDNRFRFLGFRTDIEKLLLAADIFVLPSMKEGTSVAILEAMTAGVPVIATDTGGNPELIVDSETGLLVKPCDPCHLAEAILKLITIPILRNRLAMNAKKKIQYEYSQETNLEKLVSLYDESIREKNKNDY